MKTKQHTQPRTRLGFTLLELLAVITIISMLLALILPTLSGVIGKGDQAAVEAEITQLDQALTAFKQQYGEYPPSFLKIPQRGGSWAPKSRAAVGKFWPQFNFSTSPPSGSSAGDANYLWNGGLNNDPEITLSGAECLVFFLGGVESGGVGSARLSGFSKNPLTPWAASSSSIGPFMEFDFGRLVDVDNDMSFEYLDAMPGQTTPFLYLSGSGRNLNKDNDNMLRTLAPINETRVQVWDDYDVFGLSDARNMDFCYLQPDGDGNPTTNQPYKSDTFQLISAGADGEYGPGGVYADGDNLTGDRRGEADNITNFSGGRLN